MADLSSYLDFTVNLDFSAKRISIDDVSITPLPGTITALDVSATIKQPDCLTGDVLIDVYGLSPLDFNGGRKLRLTSDGKPQNGKYIVTLTIKAEGYDDTIISKTFELNYKQANQIVKADFNLLSPSLKFIDSSLYNVVGFTNPTVVRSWKIGAKGIADFTVENTATANLIYSGNYYDTIYEGVLKAVATYQSSTYAYLTIIDVLSKSISKEAYILPAFSQLPQMLSEIAAKSSQKDGGCSADKCETADYKAAYVCYQHIANNICQPITIETTVAFDTFLRLFHKWNGAYNFSLNPLSPYDLSFCTTDPSGGNNYIKNTSSQQVGATINIDGTVTAGGTVQEEEDFDGFLVIKNGTFKFITKEQAQEQIGGGGGGVSLPINISDVSGLSSALSGKVDGNTAIGAGTGTKITYDAKGLVTSSTSLSEGDIPTLSISKISGLSGELAGKANAVHTHAIGDVSGLSSALSSKANDTDVVHKTGNENIAGNKVFTGTVSGPTPTNNSHLATKKYVDDNAGGGGGTSIFQKEKITTSEAVEWIVPENTLVTSVLIIGDNTLNVGTSSGGSELYENISVSPDSPALLNLNMVTGSVFISGISNETTILFFTIDIS